MGPDKESNVRGVKEEITTFKKKKKKIKSHFFVSLCARHECTLEDWLILPVY